MSDLVLFLLFSVVGGVIRFFYKMSIRYDFPSVSKTPSFVLFVPFLVAKNFDDLFQNAFATLQSKALFNSLSPMESSLKFKITQKLESSYATASSQKKKSTP